MKIKLLLILMFIMPFNSFLSLYGEDEVFPKSDAIWSIHQYQNAADNERWVYGLIGDTILNGVTYQKLYLLSDTILQLTPNEVFVAGIRESEKKVWVQPADQKDGTQLDEFLMYDFSKTEGDEVYLGAQSYMGWKLKEPTFEGVDTYFGYPQPYLIRSDRSSEWGRKLILSSAIVYIEGIGSLAGLFFSPRRYLSGPGGPDGCMLACMKLGDEVKYLSEECKKCFEKPDPIGIEYDQINKIAITYNKESKTLIIGLESHKTQSLFDVVNIDGRKMKSLILEGTYNEIDISQLPAGVFIYRLTNKDISQAGRFIID